VAVDTALRVAWAVITESADEAVAAVTGEAVKRRELYLLRGAGTRTTLSRLKRVERTRRMKILTI
jgi:hypothetical protein